MNNEAEIFVLFKFQLHSLISSEELGFILKLIRTIFESQFESQVLYVFLAIIHCYR